MDPLKRVPARAVALALSTLMPGVFSVAWSDDRPSVSADPVSKGRVVRQAATLVPYEQVTVYARATGFLKRVVVDIGDEVKTGDVLAEIDVPELEAEREAKTAAVDTAQAQYEKARATHTLQAAMVNLARELFNRGGRTKYQLEEARAELVVAEAEVKLAEARRKEAEAHLNRINVLVGFARVKAPFAGVITRRFVDSGSLVRSGSESDGRRLFELQRVDRLRCLIDVPERDVALVLESFRNGTLGARITFDALPGRVFAFSPRQLMGIARFSGSLHPESRHMVAAIDLDNRQRRLIPGLFARVSLVARGSSAGKVVLVPNTAIQNAERGGFAVFVVEEFGGLSKVTERGVTLKASDGTLTEVLTGLRAGERVVVGGAASLKDLKDGQSVVLSPGKDETAAKENGKETEK